MGKKTRNIYSVMINANIKLRRLEVDTEIKPFESDIETVSYFCLSNDNLRREVDMETWKKINKQVPNQKRRGVYPAVKIGRMAVTKKYTGNGFGKLMLRYIEDMFLSNDQKSGCRFIIVDAYSGAVNFYIRNGYKFFTEKDNDKNTRIMYFDLKAIG